MESSCSFLSSMNLYLVVVGITGLSLSIFSWIVCYAKIRSQCHQSSRDVLLISLVLVDILTVSVPLPIYLSMHSSCSITRRTGFFERPTICEIFHLMFVWLKLASLFVITTLNYTSYLAITARGIYRSIGDRISSSLACSRYDQRHREKKNSSIVIANLVVGIAIVAFTIASLPYIGLGPDGLSPIRGTNSSNFTPTLMCSLQQVSYPQKDKEYTFLFAVLMSSSACFVLQSVHNVLSCFSCPSYSVGDASLSVRASRTFAFYNRRIGAERDFAKMICVLGLMFHLTWIPVMVSRSETDENNFFLFCNSCIVIIGGLIAGGEGASRSGLIYSVKDRLCRTEPTEIFRRSCLESGNKCQRAHRSPSFLCNPDYQSCPQL